MVRHGGGIRGLALRGAAARCFRSAFAARLEGAATGRRTGEARYSMVTSRRSPSAVGTVTVR